MNPTTRHQLRRSLDTLEAREVPAFLSSGWALYAAPAPPRAPAPAPVAVVSAPAPASPARAEYSPLVVNDIGNRMVSFLESRLGQRVGGGECAQLAVEALRASGARFAWLTGATTDYAWGAKLTGVLGKPTGAVYGVPSARFQPGDVIQLTNARFRDGSWAPKDTVIVAAVDGAGRVTAVYRQNFNGVRAVTKQAFDLGGLVSGYAKVYRPLARVDLPGRFQFTIVNNTGGPVSVVERAGAAWASYTLGKANTLSSYQHRTWTTYGGAKPTVTVAGKSIAVDHVGAYEIYNSGTGVAVRRL